ncbi:hypothetical protein EGW08_021413 [Elysia chlorotica]|uniref:Uncharacterized protein n=1 Tax=Elysia chlorotica TaxID=188477 RepID=A0A3S1ASG0_ELYCH|nr:hypothetical protein EGW08_021413 [Elysia chlorotica]
MFVSAVVVLVALYFLIDRLLRVFKVGNHSNKHVFITSCDTGFGRDLALRLDTLGFPVFAGCLTSSGLESLAKISSSRLVTLRLDVTDPDSVREAEKFVRSRLPDEKALWAVVNNAGVSGQVAPIELCTYQEWLETCQVNLFGPVEVTRVFLPLLRMSKGRVVSIGSVMGRCAACPGPYGASKFGMEAFSDILRREMAPFGVKVCLLEPGYHRTPILNLDVIGEKIDKAYLRANPEVRKAYGGESFTARWKALTAAALEFSSKNTSNVVDAYVDALTARFPRPRYVVGWDARLLFVPLSFLPEWVGDRIQLWGEQAKLREQGFDA